MLGIWFVGLSAVDLHSSTAGPVALATASNLPYALRQLLFTQLVLSTACKLHGWLLASS
jgi:hypothetical protein